MHTTAKTWRTALLTASAAALLASGSAMADGASDLPGPVAAIEVNEAKAALGKRLFFDPRLSGDSELACASCHIPEKGYSEGVALGQAYSGSLAFRNAPSLINTAKKDAWFHDGRLGTNLNDVTRESLTETWMMNMDMRLMQERIKQDPVYVDMFAAAGLGEPSNGGVRKAIPEYLKTLTSRGAPFDSGDMSAEAQAGYDLFMGKAGCVSCHSGDRFTDDQPHVTGVPNNPEIWADPERHITFVTYAKFMGVENYMNLREDLGAYVRAHTEATKGSFLTPGLRELGSTAPYMHNGIFATLDEVVAFYNQGGGERANKDDRLKPLNLSDAEKAQLVAFLDALNGEPLTGPAFVADDIDTEYPVIDDWQNATN